MSLLPTSILAQAPDSDDKLDSRLPERVQVTIIDTTIVHLVQREPFTDATEPMLIDYLGIYAKERPWNLPDILTPQRVVIPQPRLAKDSHVLIQVYPSLPKSLSYQLLFAGDVEPANGLFYINRYHWGDKRTKGRGKYNTDNFHGALNYHYKDKTKLNLSAKYDAKNLSWLKEDKNTAPKDVNCFRSDVIWQQKLRPETQSQVNFDLTTLRINDTENSKSDSATDLKLNLNIITTKPSLNPTEFGATIEYFNANRDSNKTSCDQNKPYWANTYRFYATNKFTNFEPFTFSVGGELIVFRERREQMGDSQKLSCEDINPIQFNPTLVATTQFSDNVSFQLSFDRSVLRKPIGDMYFSSDYVTTNPLLRFEKNRRGIVVVKYRPNRRANIEIATVANVINGFVYLKPNASGMSWQPENMNANVFAFKFESDFVPIERLKSRIQFIHEIHKPQSDERIPYRPTDKLTLGISYLTTNGFQLDFEGELYGKRYVDKEAKEKPLPAYFLWKPKLSKIFGEYTTAFIKTQFSSGQYEILKGYELPRYVADVGVSVKF